MEFVGIASDDGCPDGGGFPTGWTISPLFGDDIGPSYLWPFCRLKWDPKKPPVPVWGDIPQHFERIDQDCPVVVPQGDGPGTQLDIHEQFQIGAGWPDLSSLRAPYSGYLGEVVVHVVDTAPRRLQTDPRSPHGVYMRDLIRALVAGEGEELRHVRTTLGMPRAVENGVIVKDMVRGGTFGTRGDLAAAIVSAVQDIDEADVGQGIILLALGWEQDEDDRWLADARPQSWVEVEQMDLPADTLAVLQALHYASCFNDGYSLARRVQVIAAAGNVLSDACVETQPTGPAYFADLPAPCMTRSCGSDEAFVVPVAPIDAHGRFLATTRAHGHAVNAALGMVRFLDGNTLAGSSVAAAAFAAAQALGYVIEPESYLVDLPSGGGEMPAPAPIADFGCSNNYPETVERLSLCTDCDFHEQDEVKKRWDCERPHMIAPEVFEGLRGDILDILSDAGVVDLCEEVSISPEMDARIDCSGHGPVPPPWTWPQPIDTICPKCQTIGLQHGPYYVVLTPSADAGELSEGVVEMVVDGEVIKAFGAELAAGGTEVLVVPRPDQGIASFRLRYRRRIEGVEMTRVEALFKVEDGFDCDDPSEPPQ